MLNYLQRIHLGLVGVLLTVLGFMLNVISFFSWLARLKLPIQDFYLTSSILAFSGLFLLVVEVIFITKVRRVVKQVEAFPKDCFKVTVVLTALDDQESIGLAVMDFKKHPCVLRVIVVDNNSSDNTRLCAEQAGALVITEEKRGYGSCVVRALMEGSAYTDSEFVVLCEGDMTFRAADLDKMLPYTAHADVVNGTRIVEQLRAQKTQLSDFMYFGNFAVAKLLEVKHLGRGTLTDVGTTYKIVRSEFLRRNIALFNRNINLEFNAHFLDVVMKNTVDFVEVPITFHPRIGQSKGGNKSNLKALTVGSRMILGIVTNWKWNATSG